VRRDAPDHPVAAPGEVELPAGMLEERVLARRDQLDQLAAQLRHPVGVALVQSVMDVDEGVEVLLARNRGDH